MRSSFIILILLSCSLFLQSQQSVANIIDNHKTESYHLICSKIDTYFSDKHPSLTAQELTIGPHRDGEYIKYKRWQNFWKTRLESDGQLADISNYNIKAAQDISPRGNTYLDNLPWDNISYNQDLGVQIGLGRTSSLAFHPTDPDIYYVGTALGGIWKTEDAGQSYKPLGDGLPFLAVSCVIVDQENPNNIYIAISDRVWYGPPSIGIYKSQNGGNSWTETALAFSFSDNVRVYWMEADPNNANIMLVGTSDGLYKTEDGFDTFEKLKDHSVCDIKFMPGSSDIVYYASDDFAGFFKSNDGGKTFSYKYGVGQGWKRVMVTPLDTNLVYVCSSGSQELYMSTDQGESVESRKDISSSEVDDGICMFSQLNADHIYAGWFDMYTSNDRGDNFEKITDWLGRDSLQLIHVDQRNAFCNPLQPELIYLCNDGGVYTVNVTNNEFTNLSNGLRITQYYDIGISQSDSEIMSGGSQDNGNVFMEGDEWVRAAPTADGMMQAFDPVDSDMRYNCVQNGTIYRYDSGVRSNISNNLPDDLGNAEWVTPLLADYTIPNKIYAAFDRVYASIDNGTTWEGISPKLAGNSALDLLNISSDSEKIYAVENFGVGTGNLYGTNHNRSTLYVMQDDGSWISHDLPGATNVEDITIHPKDKDHIYVTCGSYEDGQKVYQSFDAGLTWQNISGDLPNLPATAIAYFESGEDYLFVGTDAGVYYTLADSIAWSAAGNFPNTYITDIEIHLDDQLIRVGTHGRGILEASINLDQVSTTDVKPKRHCLSISPNPVKDIINTSLEPGKNLDVIDNNGQFLWTNMGPKVDMSHLRSGTYFLRVNKQKEAHCMVKVIKL